MVHGSTRARLSYIYCISNRRMLQPNARNRERWLLRRMEIHFCLCWINWHTNNELLLRPAHRRMTNGKGPTVSVTGAFPVFTDENSQLFYFRWSFSARACPFRHPRLSRSGTAECSMPRANVPNGADGVFSRDCSPQRNGASRVVALSTARNRAVRLSSFLAASRRHRSSIDRTASGEVLPNRLQ